MIQAIVVDDEPKAIASMLKVLKWYCEDTISVVGEANDLQSGLELIRTHRPQLVFLDIDMGEENGFMLLEKIKSQGWEIEVIFTTGHSDFVVEALRKDAFDYLNKPIDPDELQAAIKKLMQRLDATETPPSKGNLFAIPMHDQVRLIDLSEIIRCESDRNYTQFFLVDGAKLTSSRHLGHFEPQLSSDQFFRPHKSHLINLSHLRSYQRQDGGYLLMKDGAEIPLARGQRAALFMILGI